MDKSEISILVAEDHEQARISFCKLLRSIGYENITEAENGEVAWQILHKEKFDLVISDVQMPNMTGLELLQKIRRNGTLKGLPVIIMSNSCSYLKIAIALKANHFLNKNDITFDSISEIIEDLLEKK